MSRNYDNWEKLVGAVLRREKDRQLALFQSFSSFSSVDGSSRPSFASDVPADPGASKSISVCRKITTIRLEEIKLATQNFHPDTLLGKGRFGPMFKGWIHEHLLTAVKPGSGIAVAIRKLNDGETFCLNLPRHPDLVKLIGYSFEEGNKLLVHEFVPNGSLDNHLFTRGHQLLPWETRVKVGIGAARGLSFCHDLGIIVTHIGVKSSSILLDDDFNAKLSKFDLTTGRLSYLVLNDYAAPEYRATGIVTMESDVYSFGIILLELFSGLRVCDKNRPIKEQNLVVWATPYLHNKKKLLQIVDSRLEGQYPHDEAYKIWKLAFECLSLDSKLRPRMSKVVDNLAQLSSPPSAGPRYPHNPADFQLHHLGHVDLVGSEEENNELLPYGSLHNHLFRRHQSLPWASRVKVALDAAKGLSDLHHGKQPTVHPNFWTAEILLDEELNAKISNFSYIADAPTGDMSMSSVASPRIMQAGSIGYAAPEYIATGHLTTKSNVYTFGVVLLELLTGIPTRNRKWDKHYFSKKNKLLKIMDIRLDGQYSNDAAYEVAKVALKCLSIDPRSRPTMPDVVVALQRLQRS